MAISTKSAYQSVAGLFALEVSRDDLPARSARSLREESKVGKWGGAIRKWEWADTMTINAYATRNEEIVFQGRDPEPNS